MTEQGVYRPQPLRLALGRVEITVGIRPVEVFVSLTPALCVTCGFPAVDREAVLAWTQPRHGWAHRVRLCQICAAALAASRRARCVRIEHRPEDLWYPESTLVCDVCMLLGGGGRTQYSVTTRIGDHMVTESPGIGSHRHEDNLELLEVDWAYLSSLTLTPPASWRGWLAEPYPSPSFDPLLVIVDEDDLTAEGGGHDA